MYKIINLAFSVLFLIIWCLLAYFYFVVLHPPNQIEGINIAQRYYIDPEEFTFELTSDQRSVQIKDDEGYAFKFDLEEAYLDAIKIKWNLFDNTLYPPAECNNLYIRYPGNLDQIKFVCDYSNAW